MPIDRRKEIDTLRRAAKSPNLIYPYPNEMTKKFSVDDYQVATNAWEVKSFRSLKVALSRVAAVPNPEVMAHIRDALHLWQLEAFQSFRKDLTPRYEWYLRERLKPDIEKDLRAELRPGILGEAERRLDYLQQEVDAEQARLDRVRAQVEKERGRRSGLKIKDIFHYPFDEDLNHAIDDRLEVLRSRAQVKEFGAKNASGNAILVQHARSSASNPGFLRNIARKPDFIDLTVPGPSRGIKRRRDDDHGLCSSNDPVEPEFHSSNPGKRRALPDLFPHRSGESSPGPRRRGRKITPESKSGLRTSGASNTTSVGLSRAGIARNSKVIAGGSRASTPSSLTIRPDSPTSPILQPVSPIIGHANCVLDPGPYCYQEAPRECRPLPSGKYVERSKLPFTNGRSCTVVEDENTIYWYGRMDGEQYRFRQKIGERHPIIREELPAANAHQRFRGGAIDKHLPNRGRFLAPRDNFFFAWGMMQRAYEDTSGLEWWCGWDDDGKKCIYAQEASHDFPTVQAEADRDKIPEDWAGSDRDWRQLVDSATRDEGVQAPRSMSPSPQIRGLGQLSSRPYSPSHEESGIRDDEWSPIASERGRDSLGEVASPTTGRVSPPVVDCTRQNPCRQHGCLYCLSTSPPQSPRNSRSPTSPVTRCTQQNPCCQHGCVICPSASYSGLSSQPPRSPQSLASPVLDIFSCSSPSYAGFDPRSPRGNRSAASPVASILSLSSPSFSGLGPLSPPGNKPPASPGACWSPLQLSDTTEDIDTIHPPT